MSTPYSDPLTYYAAHGPISNPGRFSGLFESLPSEISELCRIVQGSLLHAFWAERYGVKLPEERSVEAGIRQVERMLSRLQEIQSGSLTEGRDPDKRLVGNCRTFSVLLCAILRHQGRPARARCGFGRYFKEGWYEDHWVCEYWSEAESRWILVDAQLDDFQRQALGIGFDSLDVPRDQFLVGGKAWLWCREGDADPDTFGIFDMHGLWFVRGDLVRDIASLNKVELLPWDGWGLIEGGDENISQDEMATLDNVAALTSDEVDFEAVRRMYEANEGLTVPQIIRSYTQSGVLNVDVSTEESVE
jgi:hypothetical protein